MLVLMVWFFLLTRLIGEGKQRGRGWVLIYFINLPSLPNTLICQEEKIHLAQGAVKMRKEK